MSNIQNSYNEWSKIYDSNANKTRDLDQKVTQRLLNEHRFEHVLEIGCGTGKNTAWLSSKAKSVVALDASEGMINIAKQKVISKNVQFVKADLNEPWPVAQDAFDLVSCNLVMEHIKDLEPIFNKASQSLKSDGLFFVCELHPFKQYHGTQARFETDRGTHRVDTFVHHTSEYVDAALSNGFSLKRLNEWFDHEQKAEIPRLISFMFKKNNA